MLSYGTVKHAIMRHERTDVVILEKVGSSVG